MMSKTKVLIGAGTVLGLFGGFKTYKISKTKQGASFQFAFSSAIEGAIHGRKDLEFDTVISSEVTADSQVISIPIEAGYRQTDGKYTEPRSFRIVGIVERTSETSSLVLSVFKKEDYIKSVLETLEEMRKGLSGYDIQTRNSGILKNFTLKSYRIPENYENFSFFQIEMEWIEIVEKERSFLSSANASAIGTMATGKAMASLQ